MNNNTKKELKFWSITIGIIAVVIFVIIGLASVGGNIQTAPETDDQSKGDVQASATLIEYSDFQCPACASYQPLLKQLEGEYGAKLRIIYRHFPLTTIHANAQLAAQASEAASLQGQFWNMHDILFDKQSEWSQAFSPMDKFIEYATLLNLDIEKFKTDINSQVVKEAVAHDAAGAAGLGLQGTPSFFLNGKKINNPQSYDEFKQLIDKKISAQ